MFVMRSEMCDTENFLRYQITKITREYVVTIVNISDINIFPSKSMLLIFIGSYYAYASHRAVTRD